MQYFSYCTHRTVYCQGWLIEQCCFLALCIHSNTCKNGAVRKLLTVNKFQLTGHCLASEINLAQPPDKEFHSRVVFSLAFSLAYILVQYCIPSKLPTDWIESNWIEIILSHHEKGLHRRTSLCKCSPSYNNINTVYTTKKIQTDWESTAERSSLVC